MNAIVERFRALYPEADAEALRRKVAEIFERHAHGPRRPAREWSQRDTLLITYADTLTEPGVAPLRTLADFMETHLQGAFSAVHLLPYFPSTSDDGFAISSYREVRPDLGDWGDISRIAGKFDLMTDLVLNHCSREHPLARRLWSGDTSAESWFHVVDPAMDVSEVIRPRAAPLITPLPKDPRGRGVWTTFSDDQLDFNYRNPEVLLEVIDVMAQYVAAGARLLRLDAVAYLWKEPGTACIHLPQTHWIVRLLHAILREHAPGCRLITETNVPQHENLSYFGAGDEADLVYQFALPALILQALHRGSSIYLNRWLRDWPELPPGCTFLNFIASHDGIGVRPVERIIAREELEDLLKTMRRFGARISTRVGDDGREHPYEINVTLFDALRGTRFGEDDLQISRMLCAHVILLSLPGIPAFYIHSLLASPNDEGKVRETGRARSINRGQLDRVELDRQLNEANHPRRKVLDALLSLIHLRSAQPAFAPQASMTPLALGSGFLGLVRDSPRQKVLLLCNLTPHPQRVNLDTRPLGFPRAVDDLIGRDRIRTLHSHLNLTLAPYQCLWLVAASRKGRSSGI